MKNFSALAAGSVDKRFEEQSEAAKGRRAIFVDCPPAHAGTVAALRSAFSGAVREDDASDEFAALLAKLH